MQHKHKHLTLCMSASRGV